MSLALLGLTLPALRGPARAEDSGPPAARPAGGAAPESAPAEPRKAPRRDWGPRQTPAVEVVRRVRDCVVNIHSERTVRSAGADELFSLSPSQNRVNGMGTGIVIDPRGYVVTNQHVVEDVSVIRVRLADGTTLNARVVARDAEADLALLKINPPRPLPVCPLGTARDLMVGETVIAVGNAYGYDHTVTVGVVSAVGRDVTLNKEVSYKALIQTDASINPGNSGGPLLNVYGELVGVNVAIRAGAQGIGFAIPVDTMVRSAGAMLARASAGQVGPVGLAVRDEVTRPGVEGPVTRKAVVEQVESGSPAARAGLRAGDVVRRAGELNVSSSLDLQRALLDRGPRDRLNLVVQREGAEEKLELALEAARPAVLASGSSGPAERVWKQLGLRCAPLAAEAVTRTHPQLRGGLAVVDVRPDSPAEKAGLKAGDILIGLHLWEMLSLDNVVYVLNHPGRSGFEPLRFYILRAGQVHRGTIPLD